ncbi:ABC transporter substrate-binding protein [Cohnella fermenti]|uniref:Iron-siderophore ABC transporter substrate-binding protein n=1 Tax=Cohnella fermenti TaxID=2565925 RepID=A0A4S4BRS9_9BACL|nr:iron-siderophore ABC transporter substrate-binding protein [Cohnella fermenti]THF76881.1 iron-siderophore ABC transporter substrate-binding protein [Cohnella fermenti]
MDAASPAVAACSARPLRRRFGRAALKASAAGLAVVILLAGCGENATKSEGRASPAASATSSSGANEGAAERTIAIQDAKGSTEIAGIPERVVVMDYRYVEELVALGIAPVGIADTAGYKKYMDYNPALTDGATDVGKRSEPNLEVIAGLQPDLIIGNVSFMGDNYELLKDIAPTIAFDPFPEGGLNQLEEMEATFRTVAGIFDKQDEAERILKELDEHFAQLKQTLIEHGKDGTEFVLGLLMNGNGNTSAAIKLYTDNAQAPQILQRLGLKAAYRSEEGAGDGSVNTTVESLVALQEADFIYMMMQGQEDVYEKQFKDNSVWQSLTFTKENRAYRMDKYIWMFGGPTTAKVFADTVVDALTNE